MTTSPAVPQLSVESISVGYGRPIVVRDVTMEVEHREFVTILGPSGSGKTTLLRAIAGYLRPTTGIVTIAGTVASNERTWLPPERRRIGIVPQEGALFPHLDVAGNIAFGLRDKKKAWARVAEMLEMVDLSGLEKARPHELSGGQQQRVALARALAPGPSLVLLDEPFSSLDASLRFDVRTQVRRLLADIGTTAVLVTHDQEEALSMADRVAVMSVGRIEQVGAPWAVYDDPTTLNVARFIGDLVELPVTEMQGASAHTAVGWVPIRDHSESESRSGRVVLRPEQLVLVAGRGVGPEPQGVPGTVESIRYHGHDSLTSVRLDGGPLVDVRSAGGAGVAVGDLVRVVVTGTGRMFADPVV